MGLTVLSVRMIRCKKLELKTCIPLSMLQISGFIELELPYTHFPLIEIEIRCDSNNNFDSRRCGLKWPVDNRLLSLYHFLSKI